MSGAVRDTKTNPAAFWFLAALGFAYGVVHAAGPGHGKAVVTAYMVANERALKRGIVISFLAAMLQACVAIAIVAAAAFFLHAAILPITQHVTAVIDMASFSAVALLGAWLLWRKGRAFAAALHGAPAIRQSLVFAPAGTALAAAGGFRTQAFSATQMGFSPQGEPCAAPHRFGFKPSNPAHDANCGHVHAPDPRRLGDGFSWRTLVLTVFSAGSRPCSSAILVLVFALAQGIFIVGVAATFAIALGTALTTATLAATAVLAKGIAIRLIGGGSRRGELLARGAEVFAAALVLLAGLALMLGVMQSGA
jgi:nickel/cobalt exporter